MNTYHVYLVSTVLVQVDAETLDQAEALAVEHTPSYAFGDHITVADVKLAVIADHHLWVPRKQDA